MALFSPWGNQQFSDDNGNPATGWKIYSYAAGSSTPLATYTTSDGSVAQSNPIILDSLGFPAVGQIWLTSGIAYKLVLTNASNVVKKTEDNITGVTGTASVSQWQASGLTPTYVSATSFTLAGDQTSNFHLQRRLQSTTTAGTIYSTIAAVAYTTLTTVTVVNDSGVLDAGLSAVNLGLLTATNPSVPTSYAKSGANTDITSITGNAATATNLSGGSGGTIPYQIAAGVTAMLANGTAGQVLQSNGTTLAPSYVTPAVGVSPATSTPLAASGAGAVGIGTTYARNDHVHPAGSVISSTAQVTPLPSGGAPITVSHSLGVMPKQVSFELVCLTAEGGYSVGDIIQNPPIWNGSSGVAQPGIAKTSTTVSYLIPGGLGLYGPVKTTAAAFTLTAANWAYQFILEV